MFDVSSVAALMFVGALFLTLVFGRRPSAAPSAPIAATPHPARASEDAPRVALRIPRVVYAQLDTATRLTLHPPGVTWVVDRYVESGPIARGSDLYEHLVTSLQAARVEWAEIDLGRRSAG
jgi:hypothetical protein